MARTPYIAVLVIVGVPCCICLPGSRTARRDRRPEVLLCERHYAEYERRYFGERP